MVLQENVVFNIVERLILKNDFNEDCRSIELVGKNVVEIVSLNFSRK